MLGSSGAVSSSDTLACAVQTPRLVARSPRRTPTRGGSPRTVSDLMRREFISVSVETSVDEALQVMRLARLRHLLVERGVLLAGLLSYRDLQDELLDRLERRGAPANGDDGRDDPVPLEELAIEQAMVEAPYRVTRDAPLEEAANRMTHLRLGCLPVVEETRKGLLLVGLVTEADLLDAAYNPAWGVFHSSHRRR